MMVRDSEVSFLEVLFTTYGFHSLALSITDFLDYISLVNLKCCSRAFYDFHTDNPRLESLKLDAKLSRDWQAHFESNAKAKLEISTAMTNISFVIILEDYSSIAVAHGNVISVFSATTGAQTARLDHSLGNLKSDAFELNNNRLRLPCRVLCMVNIGPVLISGLSDGHLTVWNLNEERCLSRRQLFGEIRALKSVDNWLISGHSGNNESAGVLMVRKFEAVDQMPVVFSLHQQLYPIFQVDAIRWVEDAKSSSHHGLVVAFMEQMGLRNSVPLGHVHLVHLQCTETKEQVEVLNQLTLPAYPIMGEHLMSQVQFCTSHRLLVSKPFGHLLIFRLEQTGVHLQQLIRMQPSPLLTTHLTCSHNRAVCVDITKVLVVIDLEAYCKKSVDECQMEVLQSEMVEVDKSKEVLWKHQLDQYTAVAINKRYLVYTTENALIVHDVWINNN